jgi:hypothetical protein
VRTDVEDVSNGLWWRLGSGGKGAETSLQKPLFSATSREILFHGRAIPKMPGIAGEPFANLKQRSNDFSEPRKIPNAAPYESHYQRS